MAIGLNDIDIARVRTLVPFLEDNLLGPTETSAMLVWSSLRLSTLAILLDHLVATELILNTEHETVMNTRDRGIWLTSTKRHFCRL